MQNPSPKHSAHPYALTTDEITRFLNADWTRLVHAERAVQLARA